MFISLRRRHVIDAMLKDLKSRMLLRWACTVDKLLVHSFRCKSYLGWALQRLNTSSRLRSPLRVGVAKLNSLGIRLPFRSSASEHSSKGKEGRTCSRC